MSRRHTHQPHDPPLSANSEIFTITQTAAIAALLVLAWNAHGENIALAFIAAVISFILMSFIQAKEYESNNEATKQISNLKEDDRVVIRAAGGTIVFKKIDGKLTSRLFRE